MVIMTIIGTLATIIPLMEMMTQIGIPITIIPLAVPTIQIIILVITTVQEIIFP